MKTAKTRTQKAVKSLILYPLSLLLLLGMFVLPGCNDCSNCDNVGSNTVELWSGKYAKGIVFNQATQGNPYGLIQVNITGVMEENMYYCLYKYDESNSIVFGKTVYLTASSKEGIPIATDVVTEKPAGELAISPKTSLNEHYSHQHNYEQSRHFRGHMVLGGGGNLLLEEGGNQSTIQRSSPLYNQALQMYNAKVARSTSGRVEVFFDKNDLSGAIMEVDTCHRHFGTTVECL